jgi:hypothetical protein
VFLPTRIFPRDNLHVYALERVRRKIVSLMFRKRLLDTEIRRISFIAWKRMLFMVPDKNLIPKVRKRTHSFIVQDKESHSKVSLLVQKKKLS